MTNGPAVPEELAELILMPPVGLAVRGDIPIPVIHPDY